MRPGPVPTALVERAGGRISTAVGYDPAWRAASLPNLRVEARTFDAQALRFSQYPIDIIVSRHVIEHVGSPVDFLRKIRKALLSRSARLFLETPSLEWIVNGRVLHDFFHEHCNYFSAGALDCALARAGFRALSIDPVFGGQYHWVEAVPAERRAALPEVGEALTRLDDLAAYENGFTAAWRERLAALKQEGNIAVWGAGAKGVTFVNLVDRHSDLITCLIEINPAKQNRFTPATAHPVLAPREAMRKDMAAIIVINPNYRAEIEADLRRAGAAPKMHDA